MLEFRWAVGDSGYMRAGLLDKGLRARLCRMFIISIRSIKKHYPDARLTAVSNCETDTAYWVQHTSEWLKWIPCNEFPSYWPKSSVWNKWVPVQIPESDPVIIVDWDVFCLRPMLFDPGAVQAFADCTLVPYDRNTGNYAPLLQPPIANVGVVYVPPGCNIWSRLPISYARFNKPDPYVNEQGALNYIFQSAELNMPFRFLPRHRVIYPEQFWLYGEHAAFASFVHLLGPKETSLAHIERGLFVEMQVPLKDLLN